MHLTDIQERQKKFVESRRWDRFSPTQVFSHLVEELGEVVRFFLYKEGYKVKGAGHEGVKESDIGREFAQAFNLFLQLAIAADVDLENEWLKEIERMEDRFSEKVWKDLAESS